MALNKSPKQTLLSLTLTLSLSLIPIFSKASASIQQTWQNVSGSISELDINFVLAHPKEPNIIYAGTKNAVFKTVNNGATWDWILNISGSKSKVNYIFIPAEKEDYIYVASEDGLYRSINQGYNWDLLYKGKSEDSRNCLSIIISKEGIILLGTKSGLYRSLDFGRTWQKEAGRLGEIEITAMAGDKNNPETIFIATQEGVYSWQDEDTNWQRLYTTPESQLSEEDSEEEDSEEEDSESEETETKEISHIVVDPKDTNKIFLATNNGIIFSEDKGKTWSEFPHQGLLSKNIKFLAIDPHNSFMYAATDRGVFEFKENKWHELYKGIYSKDTRCLSLDAQGDLWVATDQGVFKTTAIKIKTQMEMVETRHCLVSTNDEPTITEIQDAVIKYADVIRPERLKFHRWASTARTFLPSASFRVNVEEDHWEGGGTGTKGDDYLWPNVDARDWYLTFSWNFSDLIWDDQQRLIDNQQRYMIELRDDLLDKVTRYYFERKRLKQELLNNPPEDEFQLKEKELRLEELTAYIDALTGGYFSREIKKRAK